MPKYKLANGEVVDTKDYTENQLTYFKYKNPNATIVEDFQNGVVETDASVTPGINVASDNGVSSSEAGSLDLVSNLKGVKFDNETNTYVEGADYQDLFQQEEEEGVKALRELYKNSGLQFEESNFQTGYVTDDPAQFLGMFDVVKVTIPGVDDSIKLQFDTTDPGAWEYNLNILEKFTKKHEKFLQAPANTTAKEKYLAWENNNQQIKNADIENTNKYLKSEDLFDPTTRTVRGGYSSPYGGSVSSQEYTVVEQPYEKELNQANTLLKQQYPDLSSEQLEEASKKVVRNQLYEQAMNEAKYNAREDAISDGVLTQEEMYVGGSLVKSDLAKEYNTATKKLETLIDTRNETVDIIKIVNSGEYSEEDQNKVLQWGAKNNIFIDPMAETVVLENGQEVSSSFVEVANQLNATMSATELLFKNISDEQNIATEKIGDTNLTIEAASKNYDLHEKYLMNVSLGFADIAIGGIYLAGSIPMLLADDETQAGWDAFGAGYSQASQELRNSFVRDVQFNEAFKDYNFGKFAFQEISNQIPIIATMIASGGTAAPYVIGATTAGGKMMDMQAEIANGTADYSPTEVWLKSLGYGAAEGVFAGLTTVPILRRANQAWVNAGKEQLVKNNMINFVKSYNKKGIVFEGLLESSGEIATVGAQNLIDGNTFTQGMDHAGFSGFGFGVGFAAFPFFKGMYNSKFTSFNKLQKARTLQKEIDDLGKRWETAQTENARTKISEMIAAKSDKLADEIKKQEDIINNNLTERGGQYIFNIIQKQADLQNKAQQIANDPDLSQDLKKKQIAELQEEFDMLVRIKDHAVSDTSMLKNETEFAAFEALDKDAYDNYIDTATQQLSDEKSGKPSSENDIKDRAYNLYFGDQVRAENSKQQSGRGAFLGKNGFISFETRQEANDYIDSREDLSPEDKQKLKDGINNGNDGAAVEAEGDIQSLTIAVVENQVANQRKYTRTHEIGHQAFWEIFKDQKNQAAFDQISDQLLTTLKATDRATYDQLLNDSIYVNGAIDSAEVISKFLEYVADGKITNVQKAKGISGLFGVMVQKTFGSDYDFNFKGEQDIFNFVVGMAQKIKSGQLTTKDISAAKETNLVKKLTEDQKGKSKERRKAFSLASAQESLGNIAQEDLKGAKAQTDIAMELPGMVKAQVAKRFNLRPQQLQGFTDAVVEKMYLGQETTKWDGRGELYGFLNGRIALRIKDVVREEYNKPQQERLYLSSIDNLQAEDQKGLAQEETAAPKKVSDRKQYKNLADSKVLSAEQAGSVKQKILSTTRVLKSKLDESVSVNRTVTPIIAEIKKQMGKQADIEFKKMLGAKKDGELRRNLLKLKKPILENMTTTWLMQSMPFAVQKQVNGRFTSDWKGKKIDRETVSTDKAGRTSGAELVRRIPNAVNNVSDADFLGYMFKGDAVIRGRKEALAKAMAEEYSFDVISKELQDPNSDIRKAFEQNQTLLGVELLDNYVQEFNRQAERGNIKFSMTPLQMQDISQHLDQLKDILINQKTGGITNVTLRNAMTRVYIEENNTSLTPELISKFANDAATTVNKYFKKQKDINVASFKNFVLNGVLKLENSPNLLKAVGLIPEDIFGSYTRLGDTPQVIERRRALEQEYNIKLVEQKGKKGVELIVKYMKGHNATSSKIGGGRGQYYANVGDYYNNNLANIPGVTVKGGKVFYKGELIESKTPAQKVYKTVNKKKTPISEAEFAEQYNERKAAAKEAFDLMVDFLGFVRSKNDPVLWVATMKSLDSNMESILKASANVEYYYVGKTNAELRYEHIVPTNYMMLQLTNHFWNKKMDLDALQEAYSVAIIPKDMDENVNLQFQSTMTLNWDPLTDPAWYRYYNHTTFGMDFMLPIRKIGGVDKGKVFGEEWAKFNSILKTDAAKTVAEFKMTDEAIAKATTMAFSNAPKGISVWDFDDTLARTKSNVLYTMPDGTKGKLDAAEFAAKSEELAAKGAEFDFSEFSKVMNGSKGPMFEKAIKRNKKFGNENVYILTARPADSKYAIHEFLKGIGLDIRLENIVGLADGNPKAKADWMITKVNEGYNDFYFADDHMGNVTAVRDVLNAFDVKGKVQQAKIKFSETLNTKFNEMIERQTGVESVKEFSQVVARRRGKKKGKFKFFVPPSAEDFRGLTQYTFAGKGKQGEADQKFFEEALMDPYFQGVAAIERDRQTIKTAVKSLLSTYKPVKKKLNKLTPDGDYTFDAAVRVYLWTKAGYEIPGISKRDQKKLYDLVSKDQELNGYAEGLLITAKVDAWPEPSEYWDAQTTLSDLNNLTEKVNRKQYLTKFIENADIIFSPKNLNKIEALYGRATRDAIEDALHAMKTGSNRPSGSNKITNRWLNWVNNSVGTIMFFNRRSALLQTISSINFINWSDNNPLKAGLAFANQPQYWKDFAMIFNSDKLKQRRGGLKSDVQEAEIANAAKNAKDKASAVVSYLLKIGFTPTQIADSFAIAAGGATLYRNRVNTYLKQGLSKAEAETKAFQDFSKLSDEAQQSGDPALVSQQQRSVAGRLILAFQNTPMQYTRLMKKSAQDLINGRGDAKTHISKILYYGTVQNFIFNALQNALFALVPGFDEEELDEDKRAKAEEKKQVRILNGMIDSVLRGTGMYGAIVSTAKNTIMKFRDQEERGFMADHTYTIIEAANISPPIGSKLRKMYSSIQTYKFDKDVIEKHPWDVTIDGKFNLSPTYNIIGNMSSALLNLPLDRAIMEAQAIAEALDARNTKFQRTALALGWRTWDVNAKNEEHDLIKAVAKIKRKKAGIEKAKATRAQKKKEEQERIANMTEKEYNEYMDAKILKRREAARKAAETRRQNK